MWTFPFRSVVGALRQMRRRRTNRPTIGAEQASDELWRSCLSTPAARFRTDGPGHEFVIDRKELAQKLRKLLAECDDAMSRERRELVTAWSVAQPDEIRLLADLPYRWRSFGLIALDFIENGSGHVLCKTCQEIYSANQMTINRWKSGREYVTSATEVLCPARHTVMEFSAHFRMVVREAHNISRPLGRKEHR